MYNRARLRRCIEVDMAEGAQLMLAETSIFGRAAMAECLATGTLFDRWRFRREGRLLFGETLKLDGAIAEKLVKTAVAKGGAAIAIPSVVKDLTVMEGMWRDGTRLVQQPHVQRNVDDLIGQFVHGNRIGRAEIEALAERSALGCGVGQGEDHALGSYLQHNKSFGAASRRR
jgi:UreD urease accessory protein